MDALISRERTRNVLNSFYITETDIKAHTQDLHQRIPVVAELNINKMMLHFPRINVVWGSLWAHCVGYITQNEEGI